MNPAVEKAADETLAEIKKEFLYAQKWDVAREQRNAPLSEFDRNKPTESWLVYMKHHLDKAFAIAGSTTDKNDAQAEIRKVANLAMACLVYRGCPPRETSGWKS